MGEVVAGIRVLATSSAACLGTPRRRRSCCSLVLHLRFVGSLIHFCVSRALLLTSLLQTPPWGIWSSEFVSPSLFSSSLLFRVVAVTLMSDVVGCALTVLARLIHLTALLL